MVLMNIKINARAINPIPGLNSWLTRLYSAAGAPYLALEIITCINLLSCVKEHHILPQACNVFVQLLPVPEGVPDMTPSMIYELDPSSLSLSASSSLNSLARFVVFPQGRSLL